jgi:hypothetical protein
MRPCLADGLTPRSPKQNRGLLRGHNDQRNQGHESKAQSLFHRFSSGLNRSLSALVSYVTVRLANTYRLVGMYYGPYVSLVKASARLSAGFP